MRDLAEAGRALVSSPPAPPTPVEEIEARARGRQRRGRVRAVAALVTALLLIGGAVVIACDRRSAAPPIGERTHPPTTVVAKPQLDPRMRAHLGIGLPKGWKPVDYGDARLWVPGDWEIMSGGCPQSAVSVEVGGPYVRDCAGIPTRPDPVLSITRHEATPRETRSRVINSYTVYSDDFRGPTQSVFVPALHVRIGPLNSLTTKVLETLAPSARAIALEPAAQPVPHDWHRVTYNGISMSAPTAWPTRFEPACTAFAFHMFTAGDDISADCPPPQLPDAQPRDGVTLDGQGFRPSNGPREAVRGDWVGAIQVRALTRLEVPTSMLELEVTGGGRSHNVVIGLGPDGRIANAILHSIAPAPTDEFGVEGCAATPDVVTVRGSNATDPVVPGDPMRALLCVYSAIQPRAHLVGATALDATATARALNARRDDGITTKCKPSTWVAMLHFDYAGARDRVTVQVGRCLSGNGSGLARTPSLLLDASESFAPRYP